MTDLYQVTIVRTLTYYVAVNANGAFAARDAALATIQGRKPDKVHEDIRAEYDPGPIETEKL